MESKPIKRNENIQILSREHHFGLLFCWKIRTGLKNEVEPERMVNYMNFFWDNHLQEHFREEEEHLFLKVEDEKCKLGLSQHEEIKSLIARINTNTAQPDTSLIKQLENCINIHIRFEERELFPHLEKVLDPRELIQIGMALEHAHNIPFQDNYPDEFWK